MAYEQILTGLESGILTITLNRPQKLNALTVDMVDEMIDVLAYANNDDEVRVIVFTGAGKAFSAGADLSTGPTALDHNSATDSPVRRRNAGPGLDWSDERIRDDGGRLTLAIFDCLKPVIAAVNGPAVGVGLTMQLAMDFRIASEAARFGFVFSRRGMVTEACSNWFLPRIVGMSKALEWCYSGRVFDAAEALRGGLVKEVTSSEDLLPRAYAMAAEIRDNAAPVSIALIRQMMWRLSAMDHPMEAHRIESRGLYARGSSADGREGIASFLEKRSPRFPERVSADMPAYFPWWDERKYS